MSELSERAEQPINLSPKLKPETKAKLFFLAACFGLVFLIYGRTLAGDFVFDDRHIIERQALLSNLNLLDQVLTEPYAAVEAGAYRPITLLSYTFNFYCWARRRPVFIWLT
ncbi:MAG: hypothetical protein Q8O93_02565 [bacterium]|nr:hypothetical protein [bacterium]